MIKRYTISVNEELNSFLLRSAELSCITVPILIRLILIEHYLKNKGKDVNNNG